MQRILIRPSVRNAAMSTSSKQMFNFNNLLDKEHETKSLKDILSLPPSAFQGLTPEHDTALAKLKVTSINGLGKWKAFKAAVGNWSAVLCCAASLSILSPPEDQ
jgi:glycerol-3-phosphate O-acyltransferase